MNEPTRAAAAAHGAGRRFHQLDPSGKDYAYYQLLDPQRSILAEIIATRTDDEESGSGMVRGMEYWRIRSAQLRLQDYPSVTLTKRTSHWIDRDGLGPPFEAADASLTSSQAPSWSPSPLAEVYQTTREGDGLYTALDWTEEEGWRGDIVWVRAPGDENPYLFMDGGTTLARSEPERRSSFSAGLFESRQGPPLRSGARLLVRGPEDPGGDHVYLGKAYSGTSWWWGQWVSGRADAVAHEIVKIDGADDLVRHGDTVQIATTEDLSSQTCLSEKEGATDLVYAASDGGSPQRWTILKDGGATGDVICFGDRVKLQNGRLTDRYLSAETNRYLALRQDPLPESSLGITWVAAPAP